VRDTVTALRPVLAGERGPGGFKLEQAPASDVPIYLAALRDRMLELAGEVADGAFVNFLPISAVEHVVAKIREGEAAAGKAPGEVDVVCRFFCIPQPLDEGLALARWMFAAYGTVPVYEAFFRSLGWGDRLDPMVAAWRAGDRKRALELAPDDLIEEIFIFGDAEQQRERLARYAAGGVRTFVLTPIAAPEELPGLVAALAPRSRA
jgi:alkanesulfonate monooxygenase SsuD/methylene tetrahydromethanopterin reductase-like flavin-dependent oxidoreductase (luciferase family)